MTRDDSEPTNGSEDKQPSQNEETDTSEHRDTALTQAQIIIAGVQTNVCVDTTVRSAFIRDYDVTVLKDCVGTPDSGRSEVVFENIEQYFGNIRESVDIELTAVQ